MNRVNSDRLPVKAKAHQSWPPKNKKRQSSITKTTKKDNLSHCMLDTLKTSCVLKRSSIQNRVQLIKARRNKC